MELERLGQTNVVFLQKIERGTLRLGTTSLGKYGKMFAISWMDTEPVYLVGTGINTRPST